MADLLSTIVFPVGAFPPFLYLFTRPYWALAKFQHCTTTSLAGSHLRLTTTHSVDQWFSASSDFPPWTFGHVWRHLWLSQLRWAVLLETSGQRPGKLLNTLQYSKQVPTMVVDATPFLIYKWGNWGPESVWCHMAGKWWSWQSLSAFHHARWLPSISLCTHPLLVSFLFSLPTTSLGIIWCLLWWDLFLIKKIPLSTFEIIVQLECISDLCKSRVYT